MKTPGQFTLSEWDDTFFKDVDAARFIDMGCVSKALNKCIKYLILGKFKTD